jgi:hypothetical protein
LQPLTRANHRDWWKVGEKLFIKTLGEDFETEKLLRIIGKTLHTRMSQTPAL